MSVMVIVSVVMYVKSIDQENMLSLRSGLEITVNILRQFFHQFQFSCNRFIIKNFISNFRSNFMLRFQLYPLCSLFFPQLTSFVQWRLIIYDFTRISHCGWYKQDKPNETESA